MKRLALAPHRLYFFLGAVAVLFLFGWWWFSLTAANLNLLQAANSIPLHAILMPLGIFPLFILGFTFTAGPRWLAVNSSDKHFLATGVSYFSGIVLVVIGAALAPALESLGFGLMLCAWTSATWRWAKLLAESTIAEKQHPTVLMGAMMGGELALAAALAWTLGVMQAWMLARQLAFFCFLLPIFLTVCHRMLPFFSASVIKPYLVWRPYPLLWLWLVGCLLLAVAGVFSWQLLEATVASLLAISFAYTSWRWGLLASLQNRLLAMLHMSFAWLSVFFALHAASAFGYPLGSASMHALGLGFMATMLVAFVTRVSYGHSGRPLLAGNGIWTIYLCLHLAAILRVGASVFAMPKLISVSASLWLILIGCWVAMILPIYLKARVDGQSG
ncbi:NnrS family protein [Undibacterium sp. Ren11W]|uniref:NnrS family protein n=1 Tax=Undibacterium sp. Ren11W TaxID=3413045 RepID=UPI003BF19E2C